MQASVRQPDAARHPLPAAVHRVAAGRCEPTIEKALDEALTTADKVVKRTVDATTDEIASDLQEALKG